MKQYKLYTDGSHLKGGSDRLGIGAVLVESPRDVMLDQLSVMVDRSEFRTRYGTEDVSNPTMEMLAVYVALSRFSEVLTGNSVEILADYIGVREWMTGKWKITKPYIRKIKEDIDLLISEYNITLKFTWIKGHSGDRFNDAADLLANPR